MSFDNHEADRRFSLLMYLKKNAFEQYIPFHQILTGMSLRYRSWDILHNDLAFLCNARQVSFKKNGKMKYMFVSSHFNPVTTLLGHPAMTVNDILALVVLPYTSGAQKQTNDDWSDNDSESDDSKGISNRFHHPFISIIDSDQIPHYIYI